MKNVVILGAAGRDFHNFNVYFKNNFDYKVVAFTATQIPDIEGRNYPIQLTGKHYPYGIPILPEEDLTYIIKKYNVDECVFSYSDTSYQKLMSLASIVQAAGADFKLLSPEHTMLKSLKPVIAVCATRTGCGKSQTSRKVIEYLMEKGKKVVAIRHPMPYGDLRQQIVQRFSSLSDLTLHKCTIEEMEEYEPHIMRGNVIYSGVDYHDILREAEDDEKGCDFIVWDGGNNDMPFYNPDLMITLADPHRVGHESSYYPSEINIRKSDVVIINKIDSANGSDVMELRKNIQTLNPNAVVVDAVSPIRVDNPEVIKGKKVLVVEDGPTLTHGEMKFGAAYLAAQKYGAAEIIDPREYAVGSIKAAFEKYPHITNVLPAIGYGAQQIKDLEQTINNIPCDSIIIGTPIDLSRVINLYKSFTRVHYDLQEIGKPDLQQILDKFLEEH
ncbi:cyclic 2,3-diphosphoglycerate synthase [Plebeiibacterium sediminum]|uniref:Cyclic 2,3-diphosphoglycerate synthase n=1 Tax=Plebeiibacterium sediminum TaxID=2992112 RepID=A0AAE3M183_9BACT|nr:cyclic 2,3-diphosphoglycerate synthase [Plebeiobacterium sediminum]MCW3784854.1 cyclic 2,3-diphosphoglycerate synthase [Plebeiobacterium sediminum]